MENAVIAMAIAVADICHSLMLYRFLIKSGFQSVSPMKPLSIFA